MPPSELHLSMINFIQVFHLLQLVLRDLLLLGSMSCCNQELQSARGNSCNQLWVKGYLVRNMTYRSMQFIRVKGMVFIFVWTIPFSSVQKILKPYLTPEKTAKAEKDTPQPLVNSETNTAKRLPSKLHNYDL